MQRRPGGTPLRVRLWWAVFAVLTGAVAIAAVLAIVLVVRGPTIAPTGGPVDADPAEIAASSSTAAGAPGDVTLGALRPMVGSSGALDLLAGLPVRADVPSGYDRDSFGPAWADVDGNGCNQRDDVLLSQADPGTAETGQQGSCDHDVLAGQFYDPYTESVLTFDDLKEPAQAESIQIDHVVPLAEAYRSGADAWSAAEREQFANDLDNLVAVGGAANSAKGDSDPAHWLPPASVQCAYVETWVVVKTRWALAVDDAERSAVERVLDSC